MQQQSNNGAVMLQYSGGMLLVLGRLLLLKNRSISIDFSGKHRGFDFDFDFFGSHNVDRI